MRVCHHCGFEYAAAATQCPLCQTPADDRPQAAQDYGGEEARVAVAWEDAAERFPSNLVQTWLDCVTHPGDFFSRIDYSAGLGRPVLYYLIVSMLSAFFYMAWGSPGFDESFATAIGVSADQIDSTASSFKLLYFFVTPFASLMALGIGALVYHLFALFLAPQRRGLADTVRVLCYAGSPGVLSIIPWIGGMVGGIWSLVLLVIGIREAHRTTTGRSIAIVLLPLALMLLAAVALALLLVFIAAAAPDGFSR
ncbi:MAG: YIP1 family protein [Gemmatimonadota bacterium]